VDARCVPRLQAVLYLSVRAVLGSLAGGIAVLLSGSFLAAAAVAKIGFDRGSCGLRHHTSAVDGSPHDLVS